MRYTGEIPCVASVILYAQILIHSSTREVTGQQFELRSRLRVSIHTPTWGVTQFVHLRVETQRVSIHTPAWGVTSATNPH